MSPNLGKVIPSKKPAKPKVVKVTIWSWSKLVKASLSCRAFKCPISRGCFPFVVEQPRILWAALISYFIIALSVGHWSPSFLCAQATAEVIALKVEKEVSFLIWERRKRLKKIGWAGITETFLCFAQVSNFWNIPKYFFMVLNPRPCIEYTGKFRSKSSDFFIFMI